MEPKPMIVCIGLFMACFSFGGPNNRIQILKQFDSLNIDQNATQINCHSGIDFYSLFL
jgi:hypothetical protein